MGGSPWIVSKRQKTGVPFQIKLMDIPMQIIKRYEPYRISNNLFNIGSHDTINKRIKEVAKMCGIEICNLIYMDMKRAIITISENGRVNIPDSNVWMSEMELVELFGVIAPTLRAAIRAIYKSGMLCPVSTQRRDLTTPKSWTTFYNLEVAIALAFRLNTYEASRIRQKVLECLCRRKENGNSLFIWLGEKYMGN